MKVRHSKSQPEIELQREVAILTAVEKVREKTMAIENSSELTEVVTELFRQVQFLGIEIQMFVLFIFKPNGGLEWWGTEFSDTGLPQCYDIPPLEEIADHPRANNLIKIREKKVPYQVFELSGEDKKSWDEFLLEKTGLKKLPDHIKKGMRTLNKILLCDAVCRHGILEVAGPVALSDQDSEILCRFAKVFEQTYTRFLDLKKAEAQAREAQIEAALERVRSRSMGIQKSEELGEVASMLYECMKSLGVSDFVNCGYVEIDERNDRQHCWMTRLDGSPVEKFYIPLVGDPIQDARYKKWKEQVNLFHQEVSGKQLADHLAYVTPTMGVEEAVEITMNEFPDPINFYCGFFRFGYLCIITGSKFSEAQQDLIVQFTKVFKQAYVRFMDLKKAEEHAREAEIQLALERIRARSMAMQSSEELREVIQVMYDQVSNLGIANRGCFLMIFDKAKGTIQGWLSELAQAEFAKPFDFRDKDHAVIRKWWDFWESDEERLSLHFRDREKFEFDTYLQEKTGLRELPEEVKKAMINEPRVYFEYTNMDCGLIEFIDVEPFPEESIPVLKRITQVFEQSYIRFLDLKKAEEQAMESKIETALEKVRSRSLAMHHSNGLVDVVSMTYEQLLGLGSLIDMCVISLKKPETDDLYMWIASPEQTYDQELHVPYFDHPLFEQKKVGFASDAEYFPVDLDAKQSGAWYRHVFQHTIVGKLVNTERRKRLMSIPGQTGISTNLRHHGLMMLNFERYAYSEVEIDTFLRFSRVFEQAYVRFLDLQKAEAQAREAQIEAALERVRSRTMAMHKSEELTESAQILFEEVTKLNIPHISSGICIMDPDQKKGKLYFSVNGVLFPFYAPLDYDEDKHLKSVYEHWKKGDAYFIDDLEGKALVKHNASMKKFFERINLNSLKEPEALIESLQAIGELQMALEREIIHLIYFDKGALFFITESEPIHEINLLKRFAKVFQQTYTRFLDLKKAESQTREAQIEAAMERIRGSALAMHSSEDLKDVIIELRRQIDSLGELDLEASVIHLYSENNPMFESIAAVRPPGESGEIVLANVFFPVDAMDQIKYMMDMYYSKIPEYTIEFNKKMAEEWQQVMIQYAPMIAERRVGFIENRRLSDHSEFWNFADFSEGSLLLVTHSPATPDTKIVLRRAAAVFDIAYRRFRDLQKAEAQAREAIKQASLDRVRGEIASMRSTEDLQKITPLIWNELNNLGVPFIRCGVFIINEASENVEVFLSTPDGRSLGMLNLAIDSNQLTSDILRAWKTGQVFRQHWNKLEFVNWTQSLLDEGKIRNTSEYQGDAEPPEKLDLHFIPFKQGMLYVGNTQRLEEEKIDLVHSLAKAFAIAYSRYQDFNELEKAKQHVESTLTELKSTQKQLIHSEKMASLGELTAGIAHEIQNPLNFVNNFSEVCEELIEEIEEDLEKGNQKALKEVLSDLKNNISKIHHHGQRASGIVRGMLDHSRANSDEKTLTDINSFCDEFLRLAYHGLRAKNKSFQANFHLEADPDIPEITVVSQDIGRVLLNLINNGFQAIHERSKIDTSTYNPELIVRTRNADGIIEIEVVDNGLGISDEIKDKIFQPFFTTKPTGEGTGLGLSLAYDIVKAHGGSIDVQSTPNLETRFKISIPIKVT